jgi:hypothetical protein
VKYKIEVKRVVVSVVAVAALVVIKCRILS